MYKILENLATHGLGEPSELSGYVDCEIGFKDDFRIIDVRTLPEFDAPSSLSEYKLNIMRVTSYLELGEKVVVCCSHGMNRSNSIALGVLVQYHKMNFFKALELIQSRVPICTIISTNIVALTKLFNVKLP
jgi:rhodanese-related sulfurtransferase